MTEFQVVHGDCIEVMRGLPDKCVDVIITDPPYELGFMGKKWDASGVAFNVAVWQQALRVLKPGGYLLAFGGTRTYHRLVCAIEDSGFEIRDSIHWVYGTGFPKSLDVAKAIDAHLGEAPTPVGPNPNHRAVSGVEYTGVYAGGNTGAAMRTKATTPDAARWEGWGTALKPAHEPIVVARKPLEGTVAKNALEYGTGGLNIDATRIGDNAGWSYPNGPGGNTFHGKDRWVGSVESTKGRWPPNLVLTHAPDCPKCDWCGKRPGEPCKNCNGMLYRECVDGCPVAALNQQSGLSKSRKGSPRSGESGAGWGMSATGAEYDDEGGASRFFPIFYCAKPNRKERDRGCEALPDNTGGELTGRVDGSAGLNNPRAGAGRTSGGRNTHPTVKPVALMRWLVRLVTPPGGVVLDPFCGSGSTGIAAIEEGFSFLGVETEESYVRIARERLAGVGTQETAGRLPPGQQAKDLRDPTV